MRVVRRTDAATVFGAVLLSGLLYLPAVAADIPEKAPLAGPAQPVPAVDGINAKVSGFGGAADGRALYGGEGSITVPLGHQYGLQIDGLVAGFDSERLGGVTVAGTAGHLFWRDPNVGLLGAYGHYFHASAFRGADLYAGGAEGAAYLGRFTLEGIAGVEGGRADPGPIGSVGGLNIGTRFFDVAQLAWYPTDNLKASVGHSYILGSHAFRFGAEWGLAAAVAPWRRFTPAAA